MTYNRETKELIDVLTINELYTVSSQKTKYVYMDDNRCCHVFTDEKKAEEFCRQKEEVTYVKTGYVAPLDYLSILFRYGFLHVCIDSEKTYDILEEFSRSYFCNPLLSSTIFLLKQSGKKQVLLRLKDCNFILPVRIRNLKNHVPEISFPEAKKKNDAVYLPVFSDLEEFHQWQLCDKWDPVLIPFSQMLKKVKHDGIIINPSTNKLTINNELLLMIKAGEA